MPKRSRKQRVIRFFYPSNRYDPIDNIFSEIGNQLVTLGIEKISKDMSRVMGVGGMSIQDEIAINRSRIMLQKTEGDLERTKMLSERQIRILELKIMEKEFEIERRRHTVENMLAEKAQLRLPMNTTVIEGALEVAASPDGISGRSADESGDHEIWLSSFGEGRVSVVLGRRGGGKTALAGKMAEFAMAKHQMPIYWIGLPAQAKDLLPHWVKLVDSPEQCPVGCFMIIDEAGIQYLSLAFSTDRNKLLRALLMVCRQRHCSLVFVVQSSRDMEYSILRQADTIIFKEPGLHQPESERPDIRPLARKAALAFKELPKDKRREAAYVFDDDFEGLITSTVPSFWSEDLSHIYAHFDLAAIEGQAKRNNELQRVVTEETKLLTGDSLDKQILELRRQDYGIERIAKALNIKVWRVRKCLDSMK